jgi:hypothetical protein
MHCASEEESQEETRARETEKRDEENNYLDVFVVHFGEQILTSQNPEFVSILSAVKYIYSG